jgi:hypothetical protein
MSREARKDTREVAGRNQRVPLGVARSKLSVTGRPGYVRRWINDKDGRLEMAQQGGYTFVEDQTLQIGGGADIDSENRDLGARISRVVSQSTGQKAYLMEIQEDFYREDQKAKVRKVEEVDKRIRDGKLEKVEESYIPDEGRGIKMDIPRNAG